MSSTETTTPVDDPRTTGTTDDEPQLRGRIEPSVPIPADDAHLVEEEPPSEGVAAERTGPFADLELEDDGMPKEEDLLMALRAVVDPEIGYNIVDLGLVYEVTKRDGGEAHVLMTLTSMGCPLTEVIHQQCSVVLGALPGVEDVEVEFTFSPPWSTDKIADWVADELRAMGMNV